MEYDSLQRALEMLIQDNKHYLCNNITHQHLVCNSITSTMKFKMGVNTRL